MIGAGQEVGAVRSHQLTGPGQRREHAALRLQVSPREAPDSLLLEPRTYSRLASAVSRPRGELVGTVRAACDVTAP
jgi:hypothetical protein